MIVVCEPQCVAMSHEKVNSGFLTLLCRTYPGEQIRVYADPSHREALQRILAHDGVSLDAIDDRDFAVRDPVSVAGVLVYHRQFKRMLQDAVGAGCREIVFLSTSPVLLHVLKRLKAEAAFSHLRFVFVCHAELEDIANDAYRAVATTAVAEPSLGEKLRSIRLIELPGKVGALVARKARQRYANAWNRRFRIREQLEWRAGEDFAYIALSPHVVTNAAHYLDVNALHLRAIEMPYNFAPARAAPANAHIKFATFGFGDPAALKQVVDHLDRLKPERPYEIRIIGMDNRGLENHPRVYCASPGKQLARAEMERQATDIDAFLILYGSDRYRLSCSGAIFETLSNVKPVLHIGNPCVVEFDRPEQPIGFRYNDLEALARQMAAMIDDYAGHRAALAQRRQNILRLREQLSMAALAPKLRAVLGR